MHAGVRQAHAASISTLSRSRAEVPRSLQDRRGPQVSSTVHLNPPRPGNVRHSQVFKAEAREEGGHVHALRERARGVDVGAHKAGVERQLLDVGQAQLANLRAQAGGGAAARDSSVPWIEGGV